MAENTDVESIEFKPVTGGAISKTRLMDKPSKHGDIGMYRQPKEAIHTTIESVASHLKKHLGKSFSKGAMEGLGKDSTKKMAKSERSGMKKK